MTDTVQVRAGSGITLVTAPEPAAETVEPTSGQEYVNGVLVDVVEEAMAPEEVEVPEAFVKPRSLSLVPDAPVPADMQGLFDALSSRFDRAVADVEFRLAQAYELRARDAGLTSVGSADSKVYVEDIVDYKHRLTGFQMLSNSNGSVTTTGSIAWKSLHIVYLGVDYTVADGTTALRYSWFVKPASGTSVSLQSSNTIPVLGPDDSLVFINNGGVAIDATNTNIPYAVAPGTVTNESLGQDVQTTLSNIQTDLDAVQAQADGSITSYFQDAAPWPNGTDHGGTVNMGDVWYDSNDGGAFRWTGSTGTPANTWVRIADTDTSSIAALVNTKITTYVGTSAPAAPAGGFTTGDMWINTTGGGNVINRWNGAWAPLTFGDAAISGVGATKVSGLLAAANIPSLDMSKITSGTLTGSRVGSGINAAYVDNGTMAGARVGSGVSPAVLTGSGTAPIGAIPAIPTAKLNTAFHILY